MRGRKLLRERLGRRGFSATAWPLGGLAHESRLSAVSEVLTRSAVRTALGMVSGDAVSIPTSVALLINSMWRTKLVSKIVVSRWDRSFAGSRGDGRDGAGRSPIQARRPPRFRPG